jgi:hypothetical protein
MLTIVCQVANTETGLRVIGCSVDQVPTIRAEYRAKTDVAKPGRGLKPDRVIGTVQPDELPERI